MDIVTEILESTHPNLAVTYHHIARVYGKKQNSKKKLEYFHKELNIRLTTPQLNYSDLAANYHNLSLTYYELLDFVGAFKMNEEALKIACEHLSNDYEFLITLYCDAGAMYFTEKDYDKSLEIYEKAIEIGLNYLPVDDVNLKNIYEILDEIYYKKNNLIDLSSKNISQTKQFTSLTYYTIGNIFNKMNNYERALELYQNAHQIELQMLSTNRLYIEKYQDSIAQAKTNLTKSTLE
ncbi:unnamed protein product [Rotaria socialis]|uniref:Tetratricopeptide repeat protein n=1 Tax=Rotaria socialis TaxID=392032 RepID=A0A821CF79_9BILA|nr:unnamed protein product [Rotaria socialis]CAF4600921.1 unnamed protein product [Rotaria socialis]CAF4818861.1 unnamed protein product [Rotaria socialis]